MKLILIIMSVLAMHANIIFPETAKRDGFNIRRVNSVKAELAWEMLTDRCEIILPRNVKDFQSTKVREVFRSSDPVQVELAANGTYYHEFTGYITEVSADVPVMIKCEDEMWKLKRLPVNLQMKEATLPALIQKVAPGYEVDALEVNIGNVRFANSTVAQVLETLKDDFGLYSYFQEGKLVVGKIYSDNAATHEFHLEKGIVKNDLKYVRADDRLIKVKAVSTLSNGDKVEAEVGDAEGTVKQLAYFNITDKAELKKLAEKDYERLKIDGYEGKIEIWGNHLVRHGDKVTLSSDIYPERNGTYYVDKVEPRLTDSPEFRKVLYIGPRA